MRKILLAGAAMAPMVAQAAHHPASLDAWLAALPPGAAPVSLPGYAQRTYLSDGALWAEAERPGREIDPTDLEFSGAWFAADFGCDWARGMPCGPAWVSRHTITLPFAAAGVWFVTGHIAHGWDGGVIGLGVLPAAVQVGNDGGVVFDAPTAEIVLDWNSPVFDPDNGGDRASIRFALLVAAWPDAGGPSGVIETVPLPGALPLLGAGLLGLGLVSRRRR